MRSVNIVFVLAVLATSGSGLPLEHEHVFGTPHEPVSQTVKHSVDHLGNKKFHQEFATGTGVKGFYSVKKVDGTLKNVHYEADNHRGFTAVVKQTNTKYPAAHDTTFFSGKLHSPSLLESL